MKFIIETRGDFTLTEKHFFIKKLLKYVNVNVTDVYICFVRLLLLLITSLVLIMLITVEMH